MSLDDREMPMRGVLPDEDEVKDFVVVELNHPRKEFRYSFLLPDGWYQQPTPKEKADVRDDAEFLSLGLYTPTKDFMPPIVLSIGARPAPKKGSVAEWLEYQCYRQGLALTRMKVQKFPFGVGVDGVALQAGDVEMKMRIVMFEDGGVLWSLVGMAPVKLFEDAVVVLSAAMLSFELSSPKGPTAPVVPLEEPEDEEPEPRVVDEGS